MAVCHTNHATNSCGLNNGQPYPNYRRGPWPEFLRQRARGCLSNRGRVSSKMIGTLGAKTMSRLGTQPTGWERAMMASEKVKERLRRATAALGQAGIAYAVVGGNAVAEWVGRVDEGAVRNTKDVDILIRRDDLEKVKAALESAGFVYHNLVGIDVFVDGPSGRPS